MKSDCQNCRTCQYDTGQLCRNIDKQPKQKRSKEKQTTGTLFLYGYPVKTGPFPLLQYLRKQYLGKGFSENSLKITY